MAFGDPCTYLLSDSVAVADPVSVAGDRGAWSIGTSGGNHSLTSPRRARNRLADQL